MKDSRAWIVIALLSVGSISLVSCARQKATRAYTEYRDTLARATKIEEVLPFLVQQRRAEIERATAEERTRGFGFLKSSAEVVELTVVSETATESGARLDVRAVAGTGEDTTGTVEMVKEDGVFRVGKESWESKQGAGVPAKSCDQLTVDLKSTSTVTRARAAAAFQSASSGSAEPCLAGVPVLVDALNDPIEGIRLNASGALRGILSGAARKDPAAIAPLKSLLPRLEAAKEASRKADDVIVEIGLQNAIAAFGADAVPFLVKDLSHPVRDLRWGAATALRNLGPAARAALPDVKTAAAAEKDELVSEVLAEAEKALQGDQGQ